MANLALRKSQTAPRRSAPRAALKLVKAKQAMQAARTRMKRDAAQDTAMVVGAVAAAGLGYLEKSGHSESLRIAGIEPTLIVGVAAGFVAPKFLGKGKAADMSRQLGAASLAVAAYKFGSGQPVIAGDDEVGAGGWPE